MMHLLVLITLAAGLISLVVMRKSRSRRQPAVGASDRGASPQSLFYSTTSPLANGRNQMQKTLPLNVLDFKKVPDNKKAPILLSLEKIADGSVHDITSEPVMVALLLFHFSSACQAEAEPSKPQFIGFKLNTGDKKQPWTITVRKPDGTDHPITSIENLHSAFSFYFSGDGPQRFVSKSQGTSHTVTTGTSQGRSQGVSMSSQSGHAKSQSTTKIA